MENPYRKLKDAESPEDIRLSNVSYSFQSGFANVYMNILYQEALIEMTSKSDLLNKEIASIINEKRVPDEFEKLYPAYKYAYAHNMYP